MSYYADSGAETCRGVINLAQCERVEPDFKHFLVTSTESAFALHCKDSSGKERTYAFIVGTNADDAMHQWADEIERKRKRKTAFWYAPEVECEGVVIKMICIF